MIRTIEWMDGKVVMVDQRLLPGEEIYREYTTAEEVAQAIETMVIRGAPAIGVAAAMGIALGMLHVETDPDKSFAEICDRMSKTRPTAVNLFWAIQRMKKKYAEVHSQSLQQIQSQLALEAQKIYLEDIEANKRMGRYGSELIPGEARI
ncbi:MAG TPA: S-methyl-5-thioribose-1-phosphate isomerase, partial [Acidobacteriota bacterium]|nr:S-methyl-5-thioribose-1-phosphate isomerase [Acidobacteriota bacterium]